MNDLNRLVYEKEAYLQGYHTIIGLDEAGRGPMAGPLTVGGVIFPKDYYDKRINDSKQLIAKKREELSEIIKANALAYKVEVISVEEVDKLNVYQASREGMLRIINTIAIHPDYALTDAMPLNNYIPHTSIIKGDSLSLSIAAASILAKVTRDHIMEEYAKLYPEYGFEKHKGYVTKAHKEALLKYGVTPIHRKSFGPVKEILSHQINLFEL